MCTLHTTRAYTVEPADSGHSRSRAIVAVMYRWPLWTGCELRSVTTNDGSEIKRETCKRQQLWSEMNFAPIISRLRLKNRQRCVKVFLSRLEWPMYAD